ncbi:4-hydroxythreonine-4-phosphate dehydrogenase PdxA [Candidatus Omnitrophota bacterium]
MPTSSSNRIRIGITMGDPAGIGPEVVIKALGNLSVNRLGCFTIIGDAAILSKYLKKKRLPNVTIASLDNVPRKNFRLGKINPRCGTASLEYIDRALELLSSKQIDCLVTAPIHKGSIRLAGHSSFMGHTEYLAEKSKSKKILMVLTADTFRVSLVTRHIPLQKVSAAITSQKVFEAIDSTHDCLRSYFAIKKPRIAVCGLNPHAGEQGLLGTQDQRIIAPAVKKAQRAFENVFGPLAADTVFFGMRRKKYDCVVAMYHDQGLGPLKTLFFDKAINVTYGLPFVRTSPGHGTGFDIAGQGIADPSSMIESIRLACRLTRNKKRK